MVRRATREALMVSVPELVQQGSVRAASLPLVLLLLAAGCRDPSAPRTDAATGTLAVRVLMNVDFDPNGYSLGVDGAAPKFVPAVFPGYEQAVMVSGLSPGAHSLSVTGLAGHCVASPQSPIAFAVSPGTVTQVGVAVVCLTHG
jgi:hypothetical protein